MRGLAPLAFPPLNAPMTDTTLLLGETCLAAARAEALRTTADNDSWLVPGLFLSWDAQNGAADIDVASGPEEILRLDARVRDAPRWLSLNLALGNAALAPGDTLVAVADFAAAGVPRAALTLRSEIGGESGDTPMAEALAPASGLSVAMHTLRPADFAARGIGSHLLILHLPKEDFEMTVRDLRVMAVPAGSVPAAAPPALGDLAV